MCPALRLPMSCWSACDPFMRLPVLPLALLLGLTPSGAGWVWAQAGSGASVPVPLATVQVVYPAHADVAWQHGEVRVAFVVDAHGQPEQVELLAGAHPAFVEATLDALLATPYRPAQRDGQPVAMRVTRVVRFSMQDGGGLGSVLSLSRPVEADGRLAIAPAVQQAVWPVYPSALLRAGVSGRARVRVQIGATGQPAQLTLLAASHPDFGAATLAMLQAWRFTPAGQAGHQAQLEYEQVFDAERSARAGVPATAAVLIGRLAAGEAVGAGGGELDAPLRVLRRVAPVQHTAPGTLPEAQALLDFYVDPLGRVLLPELVSASEPGFGWAALTALNQWRFAPPRRAGQATIARGRVELRGAPQALR